MPSGFALLLILLLTFAAVVQSLRLRRSQRELAQGLVSAGQRYEDVAHAKESLARLATAQKLTEFAVDGGTATVHAVHKGIASIPFGILEAIPVTREPTRLVRGIHDLAANSVYGSIRGINRMVGKQVRRGLGKDEPKKEDDEPGKT